jgi:hypothetical protein
MPGKEDAPSGSSHARAAEEKPLDKGKGKAVDAEEKKEPKKDKDGKIIEDEKLLPPGTDRSIQDREASY